jgi:hypothetical protein
MFAKIMKWASIAALLLAAISWRSAPNYQLLLEFVVCMGAVVVVMQAVREKKYGWAAGFVAIALLFNPVVPVPRPAGDLFLLMIFVCFVPFAVSLAALKTQPTLSIPSITDRKPGSESL